jgi:hypothetical protein
MMGGGHLSSLLQKVNYNENIKRSKVVCTRRCRPDITHGSSNLSDPSTRTYKHYIRRDKPREDFLMKNQKHISVPTEAHEWLLNKAKELQGMQPISRVTLGDVVLDVIRAVEDYDFSG